MFKKISHKRSGLFSRITCAAAFKGSSSRVKLLLFLTAFTFVVIPLDLEKTELTSEKEGIEYILPEFAHIIKQAHIEYSLSPTPDLKKTCRFHKSEFIHPVNYIPDIPKDRAPPRSNIIHSTI